MFYRGILLIIYFSGGLWVFMLGLTCNQFNLFSHWLPWIGSDPNFTLTQTKFTFGFDHNKFAQCIAIKLKTEIILLVYYLIFPLSMPKTFSFHISLDCHACRWAYMHSCVYVCIYMRTLLGERQLFQALVWSTWIRHLSSLGSLGNLSRKKGTRRLDFFPQIFTKYYL